MALDPKFEGKFSANLEADGTVGRNAATVVLTTYAPDYDESEDVSVVGTSKRHPGEVYNADIGGALAMADALEKLAAEFRKMG